MSEKDLDTYEDVSLYASPIRQTTDLRGTASPTQSRTALSHAADRVEVDTSVIRQAASHGRRAGRSWTLDNATLFDTAEWINRNASAISQAARLRNRANCSHTLWNAALILAT